MLKKILPLVTAALLTFAAPALALDSSSYLRAPAVELLVAGDLSLVRELQPQTQTRLMLYSMSFAGTLNRQWTDRMTDEWIDGALVKADAIVKATDLPLEEINLLFEIGHQDALTFAAQNDFDSAEGRQMLISLAVLIRG